MFELRNWLAFQTIIVRKYIKRSNTAEGVCQRDLSTFFSRKRLRRTLVSIFCVLSSANLTYCCLGAEWIDGQRILTLTTVSRL